MYKESMNYWIGARLLDLFSAVSVPYMESMARKQHYETYSGVLKDIQDMVNPFVEYKHKEKEAKKQAASDQDKIAALNLLKDYKMTSLQDVMNSLQHLNSEIQAAKTE